jgi:hypothetical protein
MLKIQNEVISSLVHFMCSIHVTVEYRKMDFQQGDWSIMASAAAN